ncbi:glycosyltransferase family 2 protein [Mucilaginibacter calamicampi]|uniref:Glycosyltransferase family 2 protein n=1 Tax=Mucilaginibacter calamicampi TaxID=1302352 RepID=A0ABW2Z0J6_9SPHI
MTDSKHDFFKVIDNFARINKVGSVRISKSNPAVFPLASIVIPTYKRAVLLKAAIESALNQQNCPDFEVVVVDDNPERNCDTEQLMRSIADKRISYYKNHQNLGQINNWNRCFELANGKWVVMLHDDDLLLESFLHDCFTVVIERPETGLLKPQWHHWVDDGGQHPDVSNHQGAGELQRVYEIDQLMADRIGAPTGVMINREKFFLTGGFNPDFFPTADKCFVTLFAHYFEVYKLNKTASVYRFLNNESLKIETLQGFLRNDFYLFKQLCRRFKIPASIADNFLGYKLRNITGYYKGINPAFSFDKKSIGLTEPGRFTGRIAYILTGKIVSAYQQFYAVFGQSIFKKRQLHLGVKPVVKKRSAGAPVIALTISQFLEEGLVFFESFETIFSL